MLMLSTEVAVSRLQDKKILAKEEESPDPDFGEKQLATAEEQETVGLNDINDPNINFHYYLPSTSQMRTRLRATATVCDKYNVSERATAAIASAVFQDFGIISVVDTSHVDKNKVRRDRSLRRSELQLHRNKKWHTARDDSIAIFLDGRKEKTLR
ncbi:hypothetical protein AVEN_235164-1 [Araneus ventricosus]|uniref:Uncharacterized protein n=1 Tax=Araneus ventricosus TaxID=182803 RepID=A0A4Y2H5I8_ARAVE|nr:hypothetical protein AVEN_235164-1 [Araneus ventricosus]